MAREELKKKQTFMIWDFVKKIDIHATKMIFFFQIIDMRVALKVMSPIYFHGSNRYREPNNTIGWSKFSAMKHYFTTKSSPLTVHLLVSHEHFVGWDRLIINRDMRDISKVMSLACFHGNFNGYN